MGGGGDEGTFGVPFDAGLKYRARPDGCATVLVTASSSVVGGEDSSELSLADISGFWVAFRVVWLQAKAFVKVVVRKRVGF